MATKGGKKQTNKPFLWIIYEYKCKALVREATGQQPPEQSTARGAPPLTAAHGTNTLEGGRRRLKG